MKAAIRLHMANAVARVSEIPVELMTGNQRQNGGRSREATQTSYHQPYITNIGGNSGRRKIPSCYKHTFSQ
jgi:hypothetical protein